MPAASSIRYLVMLHNKQQLQQLSIVKETLQQTNTIGRMVQILCSILVLVWFGTISQRVFTYYFGIKQQASLDIIRILMLMMPLTQRSIDNVRSLDTPNGYTTMKFMSKKLFYFFIFFVSLSFAKHSQCLSMDCTSKFIFTIHSHSRTLNTNKDLYTPTATT